MPAWGELRTSRAATPRMCTLFAAAFSRRGVRSASFSSPQKSPGAPAVQSAVACLSVRSQWIGKIRPTGGMASNPIARPPGLWMRPPDLFASARQEAALARVRVTPHAKRAGLGPILHVICRKLGRLWEQRALRHRCKNIHVQQRTRPDRQRGTQLRTTALDRGPPRQAPLAARWFGRASSSEWDLGASLTESSSIPSSAGTT